MYIQGLGWIQGTRPERNLLNSLFLYIFTPSNHFASGHLSTYDFLFFSEVGVFSVLHQWLVGWLLNIETEIEGRMRLLYCCCQIDISKQKGRHAITYSSSFSPLRSLG